MTQLHGSTERMTSEISRYVRTSWHQIWSSDLRQTSGSQSRWQQSVPDCDTYRQTDNRTCNH